MAGTKKSNVKKSNNSNAKKPPKVDSPTTKYTNDGVRREIGGVICIVISIFLFVAIYFDAAGIIGEFLSTFLKAMLSHVAYILPFILFVMGGFCFVKTDQKITIVSVMLIVIILLMCATVNSVRFLEGAQLSYDAINSFYLTGIELKSGGFFGMIIATLLERFTGVAVVYIAGIAMILICGMILFNTTLSHGVLSVKRRVDDRREISLRKREEVRSAQMRIEDVNIATLSQSADANTLNGDEQGDSVKPQIDEKDYLYNLKLEEMRKREDRRKVGSLFGFMKKKDNDSENEIDDAKTGLIDSENIEQPQVSEDEMHEVQTVTYGLTPNGAIENNSNENITYGLNFDTDMDVSSSSGLDHDIRSLDQGDYGIPNSNVNPISYGSNSPKISAFERIPEHPNVTSSPHINAMNTDNAGDSLSPKKKTNKYSFPSIEFLKKPVVDTKALSNGELKGKASKLEETLRSFKVDASVVGVTQGPAVTRYEIQPNVGVRVNSIVRLADDIALSLEAKNIRIEAPIPGKAVVGIEVENGSVNTVFLREIIGSKEFKSSKSKITFAIGKDISGKPIIADLKSMPHMLIAGATGSGKSVCINSIIASLLYKATPDEVKVVLIDPKVVELGNYNGIPHLLIPVVTEPPKAAAALNWAVAEMNDRYKKFAEAGVRDLESYNEVVELNSSNSNSRSNFQASSGEDDAENGFSEERVKLPQIVIIIDELADLMMASPTQVEESICRLAQMARAAGMHLIVATQRPSVDIITGLIKANIPSRIAFAVSSQFDSRTILDMNGAEKLVGKGDMLFSPVGTGKPVRVQGTFISDSEVNKIIEHVKSQVQEPEYSGEVINSLERLSAPQAASEDTDELLHDAIETIVRANQASISMIQRRFRIGYNRAARIIDMIESRGIIGPADGARPRQVLMSIEQYEEMNGDNQQ